MKRRKLFKWSAITLVAAAVLLVVAGYLVLGYALTPSLLRWRSRDIEGSRLEVTRTYPELAPWLDSLQQAGALKDLWLTDAKGLKLHAYAVQAARPTPKTAVVVHGYTDNAMRMMHIGYLYSRQLGYNILLPDLHAHGQSQGEAIQMGWLDRQDVKRWIDTAARRFATPEAEARIVVHGISMGAATTMMLSGDSLPPQVRCFVEDCGYTSVWDEFCSELHNQFHLPPFPLLDVASGICQLKYSWNFREASALEQVRRCRRPMLFIHGSADTFVPTWMVYPLYQAKPDPKALWLAPGVEHALSYKTYRQEYTRRVKEFVEPYMN